MSIGSVQIDVVPSVTLLRQGTMWHLSGSVDLDLGLELMPDPLGEDPASALDAVDEHEQYGFDSMEDTALLGAADAWLSSVENVVLELARRLTPRTVAECQRAGWDRRQGNLALWLYARAARLAAVA
jgi:hypothetical protein